MIRFIICFLTLTLLCGCKHRIIISASSDDLADIEVTAQITLDITLPGTAGDYLPSKNYTRRFVVEATDINGISPKRYVIYDNDIESTRISEQITMYLPAREQTLTVWSDYVSGTDDLFYDISTLSPVVFKDPYVANENAKDAFSGTTILDLRPYAAQVPAKVQTEVTLNRVTGRYELVATDADAFRRGIETGNIRGSQFTVHVNYSTYLACGYNCLAGIRKELFTDMSYTSTLTVPDVGVYELPICFDYCLCAPGEKIEIPAHIEIFNEYNELVSDSRVTLPVTNGMNTVIKGRFLTQHITGGIGIDTAYDGIVNIDLGTINPTE